MKVLEHALLSNITDIDVNDFGITADGMKDFIEKYLKNINKSMINNEDINPEEKPHIDYCEDGYCRGEMRDFFLDYKNIHGYIALVICIFGTIANIFNIIVLTDNVMSKTTINAILKWLAVTDMLVMIEYIPFSLYMYIFNESKTPDLRYPVAVYLLFHMHFTQVLHTISISLTVTLAVFRYIAIKHPTGSLAIFSNAHHGRAIFLSFVISPILCFPTFFVFGIKEQIENKKHQYFLDANEDTFLYRANFWGHSVIIKLLPCVVLTVISFVLIQVLCQANKRKMKLKGYSNTNSSTNGHRLSKIDRRTDRTTTLLVAVLILFLITEFPQGILGLMSAIIGKCFLDKCYVIFGEAMDLLALINAAIGFVLYGCMSKQFRSTFKSIFFKRQNSKSELTRVTGINTTCV